MRKLIYISGVIASVLILLRFAGLFIPFFAREFFLFSGLGIFLFVFLVAILVDRKQQEKKIRGIISSYSGKPKDKTEGKEMETKTKGWSMNNSPFRTRRSGLTWGGGNVHAANAKRGTRRTFRG
jgi:TM2 domain-containing membrane protein YozV